MKAMKKYVLILSKTFPVKHPRHGEPTEFATKLKNTLTCVKCTRLVAAICAADCVCYKNVKLHTIRANYPLWKKRFEQIQRGEACLSIRQWEGKPRHSKTIEIAQLTKEDGIGLQRLTFDTKAVCPLCHPTIDGGNSWQPETIAANDGLYFVDWQCWFDKYDLKQPLAIIHFTPCRY